MSFRQNRFFGNLRGHKKQQFQNFAKHEILTKLFLILQNITSIKSCISAKIL